MFGNTIFESHKKCLFVNVFLHSSNCCYFSPAEPQPVPCTAAGERRHGNAPDPEDPPQSLPARQDLPL